MTAINFVVLWNNSEMRHAYVCYYASALDNHMFPEYLSIVWAALRRADGEPETLCDSWLAAGCDAHQTQCITTHSFRLQCLNVCM